MRKNIRNRMLAGTLVLVPIGVTLLLVKWLYRPTAGLLQPLAVGWLDSMNKRGILPAFGPGSVRVLVTVISVALLLMLLYLVGAIGQFVLGRRLISAGEGLLFRIPLVRVIYSATKQVLEAFSLPEKAAFKSVVLVEFPRRGLWAIGFLTGEIQGPEGASLCRVFIPTTPNPTTGFFEIVPATELVHTSLTVEEAFKLLISGGIVCPTSLTLSGVARATGEPDVKSAEEDRPAASV